MIVERRPGHAVQEHVLRYCAYEETTGVPTRQREPISTSVVLIFGLDTRLGVDGARLQTLVGGLGDRCQWIEHDGSMAGVQVDVTPIGARLLLGVPMQELARTSVALEDVLGREAAELEERLHETSSWDERCRLIEQLLARRLRGVAPPPPDVRWAWARLAATHGRATVGELTASLGCSRKHLAARFREHVGLPPKVIARMMRFRRASELLLSPAAPSLDGVAFACGLLRPVPPRPRLPRLRRHDPDRLPPQPARGHVLPRRVAVGDPTLRSWMPSSIPPSASATRTRACSS